MTGLEILAIISLVATLATTIIQLATPGPTIKREGPRIQDKKSATSTYGESIPIGAGVARLGTNMFWLQDNEITEVQTRRQDSIGKGGGNDLVTTDYAYYCTAAFGIAEGEAQSLCRVWADSKLIYDNRAVNASAVWKYPSARITFYRGTEDQLPDPAIQAADGVLVTPAYRGTAYLMVADLPLNDFGNRIPQLSVELDFDTPPVITEENVTHVASNLEDYDSNDRMELNRGTQQLIGAMNEGSGGAAQMVRVNLAGTPSVQTAGSAGPSVAYPGYDFSPPADDGLGENGMSLVGVWVTPRNRVYALGAAADDGPTSTFQLIQVDPGSMEILSNKDVKPFIDGSIAFDNNSIGAVCTDRIGDFGSFHALSGNNHIFHLVRFRSTTTNQIPQIAGKRSLAFNESGGSGVVGVHTVTDSQNNFWICGWHPTGSEFDNSNGHHASLWKVSIRGFGTFDEGADGLDVDHYDLHSYSIGPNNLQHELHEPSGLIYDDDSDSLVIFGDTDSNNRQTIGVFNVSTRTLTSVVVTDTTRPEYEFVNCRRMHRSLQKGVQNGVVYLPRKGADAIPDGDITRVQVEALIYAATFSVDPAVTQSSLDIGSYIPSTAYGFMSDVFDGDNNDPFSSAYWHQETESFYKFRNNSGSGTVATNVLRATTGRCRPQPIEVGLILDRIMDQAGLTKTTDYTLDAGLEGIASSMVDGYRLTRQMTVRSALEPLAFGFLFDVVESDFLLKYRTRSLNSVIATIPETDLGTVVGTNRGTSVKVNKLVEERVQDIELPERVDIAYIDKAIDHQTSNQYAKRQVFPNPTQYSRSNATIELPVAMSGLAAKLAAEVNLFSTWLGRKAYEFPVGTKYLLLDGTDLVNVENDGNTFTMRLTTIDAGEAFRLQMRAVSDIDPTGDPLNLWATVSDAAELPDVGNELAPGGATEFFFWDVPLLRGEDATTRDNESAAYIGFGAYLDTWRGAVSEISADGSNFVPLKAARGSLAWGYLAEALPALSDPQPGEYSCETQRIIRDAEVKIRIQINEDLFENSISDASMFDGVNAVAIGTGAETEIIQFRSRSVTGNLVTLTGIIRGQAGTEERARAGHVVGTKCALLLPINNVSRVPIGVNSLNLTRFFRAITINSIVQSTTVDGYVYTAADLKPLSPVHVSVDKLPGSARTGDLAVSWIRRGRILHDIDLLDGITDIPLGEESEEYQLVLLNKTTGEEDLVKTVTSETATLTSTERTDAGYTASEAIDVVIYQMSETVGRGHPRPATV